ncbi:hypothetical protein JDV02_006607 [Purpureocillium takamizusanense]|uniref:Uncharacterized protein n=1 Tax=Purpureocillium takamizusanense TaxID=2060973 RepID=A0A9Q8QGM2_9HYPO|nr:uncharacterized protein JDV02_006607 [Purpureocillium takamizusanense]UNI20529.1 hypothetical protein JDV02_006607 [Purpureocillium takamizusanense]
MKAAPHHAAGLTAAAAVLLAAVASAGNALPPDSIPLRCATICGPMVELTALCSVPSPGRMAKRRRVDNLATPGRQQNHRTASIATTAATEQAEEKGEGAEGSVEVAGVAGDAGDDSGVGELEKRSFVTIVAPPTSLPPGFTVSTPDTTPSSSEAWTAQQGVVVSPRISRVTPVISTRARQPDQYITTTPTPGAPPSPIGVSTTGLALGADGPPRGSTVNSPVMPSSAAPTSQQSLPDDDGGDDSTATPPPPPPPPPPPTTVTTTAATATSVADAVTKGPSPGGSNMGMEQDGHGGNGGNGDGDGDGDAPDPEEECVCKNRSFDVAQVAGLCADCIMQGGDLHNNMNIIMATCNFPKVGYSPARDSIAVNVNVKAIRPPGNGTASSGGSGPCVDAVAAAGRAALVAAAVVALAVGGGVFG